MAKEMRMSKEMGMSREMNMRGGHLYMQTNEPHNSVVHYRRAPNGEDGTLGAATFYDGRGPSPWNIRFLHSRPDTFIIGYAVADGISVGHINKDGTVSIGEVVKIDTSLGRPSELCWLSIAPDDRTVYTTDFGYGYITSYRIHDSTVAVAKDPACRKVPGDGTFRALCGDVSSGPSDSWITRMAPISTRSMRMPQN